jgi:hypothetical protein
MSMIVDMSAVWKSFVVGLQVQLDQANAPVIQAFDTLLSITSPAATGWSDSPRHVQSTMQTLNAVLLHRKDLVLHGIEQVIEKFRKDLIFLHDDAFTPITTSFIGKLMHDTYHAANMEHGERNALLIALLYGVLTTVPRQRKSSPPCGSYKQAIWLLFPIQRTPT